MDVRIKNGQPSAREVAESPFLGVRICGVALGSAAGLGDLAALSNPTISRGITSRRCLGALPRL